MLSRPALSSIKHLTAAAAALLMLMPSPAQAGDDTRDRHRKIQEKIKQSLKELDDVKVHERSVLGELESVTNELMEARKKLDRQKRSLRSLNKKISAVRAEIDAVKTRISDTQDWIRRKLRALYKRGAYADYIVILGTTAGVDKTMRRLKYLEALSAYEREKIQNHRTDLGILTDRETDLKRLRARLDKERKAIDRSRQKLDKKKQSKATMLASVRNEKKRKLKMLRELKDASKRLDKMIREAELKARKEAEARAKTGKSRRYSGKGFRATKGKLPWPVSGKVAIRYGKQKDSQFNTPVFRNGIYIKTRQGSKVTAVHAGKVIFADWFKGYGQLVIVNHGRGYNTLYANLSEIFLSTGDIIKVKKPIGRVGESAMLSAPTLYFEVRYKGKPLDPSQWLKRR